MYQFATNGQHLRDRVRRDPCVLWRAPPWSLGRPCAPMAPFGLQVCRSTLSRRPTSGMTRSLSDANGRDTRTHGGSPRGADGHERAVRAGRSREAVGGVGASSGLGRERYGTACRSRFEQSASPIQSGSPKRCGDRPNVDSVDFVPLAERIRRAPTSLLSPSLARPRRHDVGCSSEHRHRARGGDKK